MLAVGAALLMSVPAAAWTSSSSAFGVTIRVEGDGWGSAEREEIETLLQAVADELVDGPNPVFAHPIVVTHGGDAPVTLFARGPGGEHRIRLSARDRAWAQYAYQFGHELCHVMAARGAAGAGGDAAHHQWFEEALCEAAGLFVLRRMGERWNDDAPYPAWQDYAPALRDYAARLVAEPHRQLPPGRDVAHWLAPRLAALAADPYRRDDNEVVANLLLAHFEEAPERWSALYRLNGPGAPAAPDVGAYLRQWRERVPAEQRGFVEDLATLLGVAGSGAKAAGPGHGPFAATAAATRAN